MAKSQTDVLNNEAFATRETAFGETAMFLSWLPNPDIILRKAGKQIEVFDELITDPFIKGCLTSRKAGVLKLEWDIDMGKARSTQAEMFKSIFNNMKLYDIINKMLNASALGYQIFEIMWQDVNRMTLPVDLVQKPAQWFLFGMKNELLFRSNNSPFGEPVPPNKFLVVANNQSYNNPYGEAILSSCFWPATFKKGGLKFWMKFTEKFGIPWVVGKVPPNFTEAQSATLLTELSNMVQDGVIITPETVQVDMQFPGTGSIDVFERLIGFCKDEISMAFLGHTKAGQSVPGQLGNGKESGEVREDIIMGDKRLVEDTLNDLIKMVYSLNFPAGEAPKFIMFEESDVDTNLANRDKVLWDMGVRWSPNYIKKRHYLDEGDFTIENTPTPTTSAAIPVAPKATTPLPLTDTPTDTGIQSFAQDEVTPGQQLIDNIQSDILRKSKELIGNLTKPVKDYINGKNDFASAIDGLAKIYPKLNTDELYNELVKMQFAAELVGRFEVKSEKG